VDCRVMRARVIFCGCEKINEICGFSLANPGKSSYNHAPPSA
jgi:hypothetical protein